MNDMLWNVESEESKDARKNAALLRQWKFEREWHPWFAWYPVLVTPTKKAWLRFVDRRLSSFYRREKPKWWTWGIRNFEYRPIKKAGLLSEPG